MENVFGVRAHATPPLYVLNELIQGGKKKKKMILLILDMMSSSDPFQSQLLCAL